MATSPTPSEGKELILLDFWASMFAMRVKIALAEKGITDYECREEDIVVSKSPFLLQMNPVHKKVPVLIHNRKPICESLIIVEYIDEVWNHTSPLLPTDPYLKSHAKFWADFVDKKVYPAQFKIWGTKEESQEETKKELIDILKTLEQELGDKCYFGGDNIGFVDIALIPYYSWFHTYEHFSSGLSFEAPSVLTSLLGVNDVYSRTPSPVLLLTGRRFWKLSLSTGRLKVFPPSRVLWTSTWGSKANAKTELIESLKMMEKELGNKSYFGGDAFGFVDIALIPFYSWFKVYEVCGNMRIQEECPQIISWAIRCEEREGVKKCVPSMDNVANLILDIRTKHGIH